MEVALGNGTVKNAMGYLLSQTQGTGGSLTTKIRLLDSSSSGILVVTFYLSNRLNGARRLLAAGALNYTKSSYQFVVVATENSGSECAGSFFDCNRAWMIAVIVCCSAALLVGLALIYFFCCRRRNDAGKYVEQKREDVTSVNRATCVVTDVGVPARK